MSTSEATVDIFRISVIDNPTVMAGAERLDVKGRVFHGDLVRFEGQLLFTGRSSATVQVQHSHGGSCGVIFSANTNDMLS